MSIEQCPEPIAKAIMQVMRNIKKLENNAVNEHHNYRFVGIDKYYDEVRPLLNDAGLIIVCNEEDSRISSDNKTLKVRFSFVLMHESGVVWNYPIGRTVYTQFKGAQACGTALSYAEKFLMRCLFKISSGEADDEEASPEASVTYEPDSQRGSPIGKEPDLDFSYSGAPYRIFNARGEVIKTCTDSNTWAGMVVKEVSKSPKAKQHNSLEANRIAPEVDLLTGAIKEALEGAIQKILS